MKLLTLGLAITLCGAGASLRTDAVTLEFAPADGSEISLVFERVFTLHLDQTEIEVELDGESVGDQESPAVGYDMSESESIAFTDRFEVTEGRVVGIRRAFETIGTLYIETVTDPAGEKYVDENEGQSELEGSVVLFRWDEDDEVYGASFGEESEDLDTDLLEGIDAEANLAGFLPDGAVEVGDSWDVNVAAFVSMINLSGSLKVLQEDEEESADDSDYGKQFDDNLTGEIEATLAEIREEGGVRLAVIKIASELSTTITTSTEVDEGDATGTEEDEQTFEFELAGELVWDMAAGHLSTLALEGDLTLEMHSEKAYSMEDHELTMTENQSLSGGLTFAIVVD